MALTFLGVFAVAAMAKLGWDWHQTVNQGTRKPANPLDDSYGY